MSGLFLFAFPFLILGIVWFFVWLTVRENREATGTREISLLDDGATTYPVDFQTFGGSYDPLRAGKGTVRVEEGELVLCGRRRKLFSFAREEERIAFHDICDVSVDGRLMRFGVFGMPPGRSRLIRLATPAETQALAASLPQQMSAAGARIKADREDFALFNSEQGWPYATVAIIALNLFVYALAGYAGAGWMKVTAPSLFKMGGNLAPATATGEWHRLFIAMFLHGGFMHVAFNMLALWEVGRVSERLMGRWRYLLLYVVAGVTGSLFSINWRQDTVSVGASGAVFGVYGGLIAALLFERGLLPPTVTQRLRAGAIAFVVYALVSGFSAEHVDNAAHIGGLLAGAILGAAFFAPSGRAWALSASMACILAFSTARAIVLAEPIRDEIPFRDFLTSFPPEERRLNELHNKLLTDGKSGVLSVQEFAARLDREVIPGWRRQERKIEELRRVGERSRKIREPMSRFIRLRRQSMELLRDAMRRQDAVLLNRYNAMVGEANAVLKELNEASSGAKSADS